MIAYNNHASFAMIFYVRVGSVVGKASRWAAIGALLCLVVFVARHPEMVGGRRRGAAAYVMRDLFEQPYSHHIISYMVVFLMIFRINLSYDRYWMGLRHLYESINRLNCAAGMVIAFDEFSTGNAAIVGFKWRQQMMHLFSLLAATQVLELRFPEAELSELKPLQLLVERTTTSQRGQLHQKIASALSASSDKAAAGDPLDLPYRFPLDVIAGIATDEKRHLALHAPR